MTVNKKLSSVADGVVVLESTNREDLAGLEAKQTALKVARTIGFGSCALDPSIGIQPLDNDEEPLSQDDMMAGVQPAGWRATFKIVEG